MPNAIKYKTGNLTGSIEKSNVALGISAQGPTSTTGWYSGLTPDPNRYVVYKTDASNTPRIFYPADDNELIRLAKQEGATGANTGSATSVLSWMATQTNLMAVNKAYPNIVTDRLVYLVDSSFTPSYPTTDTTVYSIENTGGVGNGTLQNGVGFNSSAGAFIFDGSDDQIPLATSDNFANIDWSTGITIMVLYKIDAVTDFNGQFRAFLGVTGGDRSFNFYLYGPNTPATQLYYHFSANYTSGLSNLITVTTGSYHLGVLTCNSVSSTYYHDGIAVGTQTPATPSYYTAGGTQYLGRADNMWKGNITKWMIYNKALTQAEIYQNYYQGNIVTNSLSYLWDAGNLVSYPGSGVTTYNMTGSIAGNLQNGVGFNTGFGGYWSFDGSNDSILLDNANTSFLLGNGNSNWTVNAWVRTTTSANSLGQGSVLSNSNSGPVYSMMGVNSGKIVYWTYQNDNWSQKLGSTTINDGNWHMLTWVNFSNSTMTMYVDGVLDTNVANSTSGNNNPIDIIGGSWAGFFQGDIANIQVYQGKAFSLSEVKQNFSAYSSRFGK
jgi:hypothetical protein